MSKKAFGGVGHGGKDPGALGNGLEEADLNLMYALAWENDMKRHGIDTKLSRYKDENDDLAEEIRECNAFNPDIAVDFHTNSGGGDGFEVFVSVFGKESRRLGELIEKQVLNIGQNSRGVKTKKRDDGRDYFGFIRQTVCPSVIAESAFIDTKNDISFVDTKEKCDRYGKAIAKACLEYLGIPYKEESNNSNNHSGDKPKYIVATGAYNDINNAKQQVEELKKKGINSAYIHNCEW